MIKYDTQQDERDMQLKLTTTSKANKVGELIPFHFSDSGNGVEISGETP